MSGAKHRTCSAPNRVLLSEAAAGDGGARSKHAPMFDAWSNGVQGGRGGGEGMVVLTQAANSSRASE